MIIPPRLRRANRQAQIMVSLNRRPRGVPGILHNGLLHIVGRRNNRHKRAFGQIAPGCRGKRPCPSARVFFAMPSATTLLSGFLLYTQTLDRIWPLSNAANGTIAGTASSKAFNLKKSIFWRHLYASYWMCATRASHAGHPALDRF